MSTRSRKIINLIYEKYDNPTDNKENTSEVCYNVQNEEERDSPLPAGAHFTQEELSILNDIDLEDTDILLQDLPSNSSIFPNDIPEFSPAPNNKQFIEKPCHKTESFLLTNSSLPSEIEDSQPNTPNPSFRKIYLDFNVKENPSTSICHEKINDDTPMPSPYVDFCPSPFYVDASSLDSPVSTPATYINDTDSPVITPTCRSRKRILGTKKDKGRQRERFLKDWKDEVRKRNVNRGLQYTSRNGKVHNKKLLKPPCPTTCRKKCNEKISEKTRAHIFKIFWNIGDHSRQWDFLTKYATKNIKKRITTDKENTKRLSTISYTLPIYETGNVVIRNIPVCKTMFLNTLSISFNFLYTALEKLEKGQGVVQSDQRGKHVHHLKKITDDMKCSVLDHVAKLSPVESHYTRKDSTKKYLDGSLSFPKMYKLYLEWFDPNKYKNKVTSVRQYRDIINKNLNISFHKPKKDICEECHIFENNKQHTEKEISKQAEHLKQKDLARKLKAEDKELAQQRPEILTAAYDLQKCLNVPHGNVSTFYYKRKLTVYNFTIFDIGCRQGYCFAWHEQTAKRGANEIASCVYKFIEQTVKDGIKDYRFWSDNCGGQNRNRIVFLMYMMASYKYKIQISHRFLIVGHTQNEGDSMHALIERQTRDKILYTPAQWYMAFQFAKTDDKPYKITEVSQDFVMDFKNMLKRVNNWVFSCDGSKIQWNKVTELKIEADNPYKLFYKTSYMQDSYNCIDCANKPKATRNKTVLCYIEFCDLRPAYNKPIPIDKNKHKDLMDMCHKLVIPKEYHLFFANLIKANSNTVESDSE